MAFMTRPQVARHYGVCGETIKNYVRRGQLPAPTKSPSGRDIWDEALIRPAATANDLSNVQLPEDHQ
jgi:hypothetical protein